MEKKANPGNIKYRQNDGVIAFKIHSEMDENNRIKSTNRTLFDCKSELLIQ